ncbi:alpha-ketoglutarate-dependent dioxygenase AlkB [Vibrio sp. IRLE0018]|uniref:alpha-ketoglutarate-dependent dioxygenase AlkB family protein n=1 Tax=Vibrio TaxID=662 RepID=UPI0015943187|nr:MULTISPECIES: alpha-ketoglutarate-dependent dioxygenase AlkB [Vibrio]MCF8779139.1 alpha-ketoglutarate-dependent dioxygenase AlkB [Vibrio floridensis]NVC63022.1 alpha-ketoglutarate-dependent dioxygenase AlkB [Vibrio sp. 05-20-BW147]HAS6347222.1 alpha-ketoglutarate-dependent dioxygenase AlkB [Vibrio vulnificus]
MSSSLFLFETSDWLDIEDGQLLWRPNFLDQEQANQVFAALMHSLAWEQKYIRMFGQQVLQPRLQAWYGEERYHYSGLTMEPLPWTPMLKALKVQCELAADTTFNSVLANLYRDGQDSMGWHQDNEAELGSNPIIASLSLGETRRFVLQHKVTKQKIEFELTSGSLLVMGGTTQHFWQHCVPKTAKNKSERINLTYRKIIPTAI